MADSTTNLAQIDSAQAQKEVTANGLFDAASPAMFGGRRAEACAGLVWGYYGGRWGGNSVANGTLTLLPSTTNYIAANRLTGAIMLMDGSPDLWANTSDYGRLYSVVTGAASVTSYEDRRSGPDGIFLGVAGISITAAGVSIADPGGNFGSPANVEEALADLATRFPTTAPVSLQIACSDLITAITTGSGKAVFRMPHAMTLTAVRASLATAQASGSIFTVDINEGGTSVISTKITIDNTEKTSTTAATPPVISDATLADDAEITIDVDQVGDGTAKGLVVTLTGTRAL